MLKFKSILLWSNLFLILVFVNYSIFNKENILKNGKLIYLELAPVDPRSIMAGDYMALNYRICVEVDLNTLGPNKYLEVGINKDGIARMFVSKSLPDSLTRVTIKTHRGKYGQLLIGAESYFFQEGTAEKYEKARFGGIRIDEEGTALLEGLYDDALRPLN